jgi:hypothetical protein
MNTRVKNPLSLSFEDFDRALTSKDYMDGEPDYMQSALSEMLGVVSLTSDPTNKLMSAHYGLNSGVAIG